jgi:hypothetical protein
LNEGLLLLHDMIVVQLRDGQKWALSRLRGGIDTLLVAKTGFRKTLGFHPSISSINYKVFSTKNLNLNLQSYSDIPEDSPA